MERIKSSISTVTLNVNELNFNIKYRNCQIEQPNPNI